MINACGKIVAKKKKPQAEGDLIKSASTLKGFKCSKAFPSRCLESVNTLTLL